MSEFKFSCPTCGQHLQGDDSYIGNAITCPNCKQEFTVPNPKVTTSLRIEHERWVPPPQHAHAAPATIILPSPAVPAHIPTARLAPKTSGLAIAALVLSVLEPFGCVPAIICGHIAWSKTTKNPLVKGKGLALAALIIGYTFFAVTALGLIAFFALGAFWRRGAAN